MSSNKCKVEIPSQLPESGLTRVQGKSWKDSMLIYLKQNDNFLPFLPGGRYASWLSAETNTDRIERLDPIDERNSEDQQAKMDMLIKRQRDLSTMLNIIARKVDTYDYDDVMNLSTSIESIWNMIDLVYDIGRKGVHFLDLAKIKYDKGDSPSKHYKKIYHHFQDNLYKKNDVLLFKNNSKLKENEIMSPTMLNFILFYTIETIDKRLMKVIKEKWGHIMDEKTCLHDLKDTLLKAVPDLIKRLDEKELEANAISQLSAFGAKGNFNGGRGRRFRKEGNKNLRMFCRLCKAANCPRRVYNSHNIGECKRWSKKDVEDLRVMICEMQVTSDQYDDSSDTDQD